MITEDYVSLEVAKLLKQKDFKGEFHKHYWGYEPRKEFLSDYSFNPEYDYPAPTLAVAMKWLREVHNYHICISIDSYVEPYNNEYYIFIRRRKDRFEEVSPCEQVFFETYEEAAEAAIKYCLENLI